MKKRTVLIGIFVMSIITGIAQVPEKLNYQAVVRNNNGDLITNQSVNVTISIIDNTPEGTVLYTEMHNVTTSKYGVINLLIGDGAPELGSFSQIEWNQNNKFLSVSVDVGDGNIDMGTVQLLSVPYAFYASSAEVLGSKGVYSTSTDTLFVVKDHEGNVVFAVFPDGAQVIVNESTLAKGKVGGFAVSGRSPNKAVDLDILRITADSTRIYVNDTVTVKGKVGGFAVSGRSPNKGTSENMLIMTTDSTRIFTKDTVSGFGIRDNSGTNSTSYMQLTPINYFIGHRAGESVTTGKYNTFIGYETGINSTWGNGNMFIGFNAGHSNVDGAKNIFIGNEVGYNFTGVSDGEENIFIGSDAGRNCTTTANSIFIGTRSGLNCGASYGNTFIGDRTASIGVAGDNNTLLGSAAGYRVSGSENVFIGALSGNSVETGNQNTFIGYSTGSSSIGSGNVFIGANAGDGETGDNKLYIANNASTALIYGDFAAEEVLINGDLTATTVTPSDINLKTNLVPIKAGLNLLLSLNGYYFNWNEKAENLFNFSEEEQQIGVIAQEVEKVLPQMVKTNSRGYKVVDYSKLSPVIIEAIKEQQKYIESLEAKNKQLEERLTRLEEQLLK